MINITGLPTATKHYFLYESQTWAKKKGAECASNGRKIFFNSKWYISYEQGLSSLHTGHVHKCSDPPSQQYQYTRLVFFEPLER
jgi:hypothetical protein